MISLLSGLRPELMPKHVAIVMDGNRRWAEARGLTTPEGHEAGAQALKKIIELSVAWGIRATTMFAFSQENFKRPQASKADRHACYTYGTVEVDFLMYLIEFMIRDNMFMR
nr:unnamed protein product [Digitaria exilis]